MARTLGGIPALLLATLTACGGASGASNGGGGGGSGMSATIEGQAFSADQFSRATVSAALPGNYILVGSRLTTGTTAQAITLILYNISATGTYPLGVNSTNVGGTGSVTEGSTIWLTPLNGAAGTVAVTALTSTGIAGTFSFTAADPLNASSTRAVTSGSFNLAITGTPGTVLPNHGSSMSATIGGAAWNGATIVVVSKSGGTYAFNGSSVGSYSLTFFLSSITGPGTYALSNTGPIETLQAALGIQGWSSQLGAPSGSVVVSSVSNDRIQGTFVATLSSANAGSPLAIASGTFSVGL